MGSYKLYCPDCKSTFDDNFTHHCPRCGTSGSLIKTEYTDKQLKPLPLNGFWKFLPWLPCEGWNQAFESQTIVYKSDALGKELGLNDLYIAFNGYWPERQANMMTCTFKELEAPPTFQRAAEKCIDNLVIASAGNTARAFIFAAQHYDINLFVVIPYSCKGRLVFPFDVSKNVTVIATGKDSDYSDSIGFAARLANEFGLVNEGGVRNVARRDGMGTVMLQAALIMKKIPKHYFQAVGSGTGAIAVLEASNRLINDGGWGNELPKLHLAQNQPFIPMVDAWNSGSKELAEIPEAIQREAILKVYAKVLTNRHPPYSVGGGVFDSLSSSHGTMYPVSNDEARAAGILFESLEGVAPVSAACVAVGCLIKAAEANNIDPDETILLNITGGGQDRLCEEFDRILIEPDLVCEPDIDTEDLKKDMEEIRGRKGRG